MKKPVAKEGSDKRNKQSTQNKGGKDRHLERRINRALTPEEQLDTIPDDSMYEPDFEEELLQKENDNE